ncbi:hypothetical protein M758_3G203600 [Ceratodon purpureus]|nr:hypothetical protein M758_3G203600 [Ceratodon purpureus]
MALSQPIQTMRHTRPNTEPSNLRRKMLCRCILMTCNLLITIKPATAQQAYNNVTGYDCTSTEYSHPNATSCNTYTMYRSQSSKDTIQTISKLFNASASTVANLSELNLTTSNQLAAGDRLYIPLHCECRNGTYQAMVKYIIQPGDTFDIVANSTFEGLTTYQAIEAANPDQSPYSLAIGQVVNIPLRCACPSTEQVSNGTRFLLSFMIFPEETLEAMSNYFNISVYDLIAANVLSGETQVLEAFSTMLIPLVRLRPLSEFTMIIPIPDPGLPPSPAVSFSPGGSPLVGSGTETIYMHRSNTPLYIGVAIAATGFVLAAALAVMLTASESRRQRELEEHGEIESQQMLKHNHDALSHDMLEKSEFLDGMSTVVEGDKPVIFNYGELRAATNDFSADNLLQGSVFCGKLNGVIVAIKQMKGNMAQEIKILSQIHHMNVVRLLGVCVNDAEHLFMVFEYAENGSLSDCLHSQVAHPTSTYSRSTGLLSWTRRVQIALDIASGLEYIHNYTNPSFVHKDVKSSNILLDADWHAKVANFGMAKSANSFMPGPMLTNHIVGTQGYMAPEYLEHGLVTTKADVYSFGVVLLELITGEEAIVQAKEVEKGDQFKGWTLASVMSTILKDKEDDEKKIELQNWVDSRLEDAYPLDIAVDIAKLAKSCVNTDLTLRPAMKEITFSLSNILTASLEWEATVVRKNQMPGVHSAAR